MASTVTIDLRHVARGLDFPLRQVQAVVELLDEGNTVPFITRYRKDQTGGLDEEQIREIQDRLAKMRLLADRKQTILRSIDAQGKLTEKLAKQILGAATTKRLEDLYLPYKPKKQTLATLARSRGLEELANEIFEAAPAANDLDARSRDFANPDRQVPSGADALLGAGHILAEQFSERADLRQRLREILQKTGKVVTTQIAPDPVAAPAAVPSEAKPEAAETDRRIGFQPVSSETERKAAATAAQEVPSPPAPLPVGEGSSLVPAPLPVGDGSSSVPAPLPVGDGSSSVPAPLPAGDGSSSVPAPLPAVEGSSSSAHAALPEGLGSHEAAPVASTSEAKPQAVDVASAPSSGVSDAPPAALSVAEVKLPSPAAALPEGEGIHEAAVAAPAEIPAKQRRPPK